MKITFFDDELVRRSSLVFIATLAASIITFVVNLIIANILGIQFFGTFRIIVYLFAFLPAIADLGINSSLTKYISELKGKPDEINYVIRWLLKVKVISYAILTIIVFSLGNYIAIYFLKDASLIYLVYAGMAFLIFNFFTTFSFVALGFQDFKLYSLTQFLSSLLTAVFALLLSPFGIFYIILGWSLGPILGNIPNMTMLIKKKVLTKYKNVDMKRIFFKFSLPIFPIDVTTALINVIVPVLGLFFSLQMIGYYSFAFFFYVATTMIPNSLSVALFPKVSELNGLKKYGHAKDILKKSLFYYTFIAVIGLAFVFLLSEWFIATVSSLYLPSLLLFKVIVSLGLIFGYNIIYTNYLKGLGKVKEYAIFTLAQNVLLIVISFYILNSMA